MERIGHLIFLIIILLIGSFNPVFTQRFMKMHHDLKSNSTPLKKKQARFISSAYKYQYGNYKVISHKPEWDWEGFLKWGYKSTRINSRLAIDSLRSKSKHSMVFVNSGIDTAVINTSVNEISVITDRASFFNRFFFDSHEIDLTESKGSFVSIFKSVSDTSIWDLVLVYPVVVEMGGNMVADQTTQFKGLITDGSTIIEIVKVTEPEKGEVSIWKPVEGFEFIMDYKSIAAVQTVPLNAQFVWIHEELDEGLKMVLATAAACIYRWALDYQISWEEHMDEGS